MEGESPTLREFYYKYNLPWWYQQRAYPENFTHETVTYLSITFAGFTMVAESGHSCFFWFYFFPISISWNKTNNKKQNNDNKKINDSNNTIIKTIIILKTLKKT